MSVKLSIELCPFEVPARVLVKQEPGSRQEGFKEAPSYKLAELDVDTLEKLCDEFRENVFKFANKPIPPR